MHLVDLPPAYTRKATFSSPEPKSPRDLQDRKSFVICVVKFFSNDFSSGTAWPFETKLHAESFMGWGNKGLFVCAGSHVQDGRHAHIW